MISRGYDGISTDRGRRNPNRLGEGGGSVGEGVKGTVGDDGGAGRDSSILSSKAIPYLILFEDTLAHSLMRYWISSCVIVCSPMVRSLSSSAWNIAIQ